MDDSGTHEKIGQSTLTNWDSTTRSWGVVPKQHSNHVMVESSTEKTGSSPDPNGSQWIPEVRPWLHGWIKTIHLTVRGHTSKKTTQHWSVVWLPFFIFPYIGNI